MTITYFFLKLSYFFKPPFAAGRGTEYIADMEKYYVYSMQEMPRLMRFPARLNGMGYITENFYLPRKHAERNMIIGFHLRGSAGVSVRVENGQTRRHPWNPPELGVSLPGTFGWIEAEQPWDEVYFSYVPCMISVFRDMGVNLESIARNPLPITGRELLSRQLAELEELCRNMHLPGAADRMDSLAFSMIFQNAVSSQVSLFTGIGNPSVRQAAEYFARNFRKKIDLSALRKELGMSESAFYREWRKEFGKPVHSHLIDLRLDFAEQLLRSDAYTLKEIAAECGFSNAVDLCRHFRKRRGMPPGKFRESQIRPAALHDLSRAKTARGLEISPFRS